MNRVLVVAAIKLELAHIRPKDGWTLVANGPGPKLAGEAVDGFAGPVDVMVSTGLCGALEPGLRVGDVFVATDVNGMPALAPRTGRRYAQGPLVSIDRVAGSVEEKRRLRSSGAMAVEMEAAAVAERARRAGAKFYCVRVVSDTADEDFAVDFNAARDGAGRFSIWSILGQAARRPVKVFPELLRLKKNGDVAARALGEFLADCDF